jgi:hypothetical protein
MENMEAASNMMLEVAHQRTQGFKGGGALEHTRPELAALV